MYWLLQRTGLTHVCLAAMRWYLRHSGDVTRDGTPTGYIVRMSEAQFDRYREVA